MDNFTFSTYSVQCWLRQWIRVLRHLWRILANFPLLSVKSALPILRFMIHSGSSPEEYRNLISLVVQFPCVRRVLGSTVDASCASVYGDSGKKFPLFQCESGPRILRSWWLWMRPIPLPVRSFLLRGRRGCGRARRRQRWHVHFWVCWCTPRASGPRCSASWSVWTRRTGMQWGCFAGDDATCVVFPSIGGRPEIFGIMIGLDSTDSLQ